MASRCTLLLARSLVLVLWLCSAHSQEGENEFLVAAYLPDYRSYINVNAAVPYLTDLILFSVKPTAQGTLGDCCLGAEHYQQARDAKKYKQEKNSGE